PLERPMSHQFVPHVTIVESATPGRIEAALVALADFRIEVTFDAAYLLQEHERHWRPIADARFEPALVVGRGGIETEISVSPLADPQVVEFAGRPGGQIEDVVVARRAGEIVA